MLGHLGLAALALVPSATLYDLPVSNHGARVRLVIYKKQLEDRVSILPPAELGGGLRSAEYLAKNPQGKMPLLLDGELAVYESDAICRHLLDKHADCGPSLSPSSLAARTKSEMLCRLHDAYLGPIQGCLYKPAPPFGRFGSRAAALRDFVAQLGHAEALAEPDGPYLTGPDFSLADATLFPTAVFAHHMLPKFEGAGGAAPATASSPAEWFGPKLTSWWEHMTTRDAEGMRVLAELRSGLAAWDDRDRWGPIRGAGLRDTAPPSVFDQIVAGEIPSEVVHEDDLCLAFRDIAPAAPTHILLIPKTRDGLGGLGDATAEHAEILGHLMSTAAEVAERQGLREFRLVTNHGATAGQTVPHLHLHLLGGRTLHWPPG